MLTADDLTTRIARIKRTGEIGTIAQSDLVDVFRMARAFAALTLNGWIVCTDGDRWSVSDNEGFDVATGRDPLAAAEKAIRSNAEGKGGR